MTPPPQPPKTGDAGLDDWNYKMWQYVKSLTPRESLNTRTSHTAHGVTRESKPQEPGTSGGTGPVWL